MDADGGEEDSRHGSSAATHQTADELIARCIAPVKTEFLRPPPDRTSSQNDDVSIPKDKAPVLAKEKKSKRQLKRERRQVLLPPLAFPLYTMQKNQLKIRHAVYFLLCRIKNQRKISVLKFPSLVM